MMSQPETYHVRQRWTWIHHEMNTSSSETAKPTPHHNRFMALFWDHLGEPVPEQLLDFMVQRKINRGRHTNHLAGGHSIRTNQCPPPPSPHFFTEGIPFVPPNKQCQSTEGQWNSKNGGKRTMRHRATASMLKYQPDDHLEINHQLEMWANAQRDGRPAEYRWRPLFNATKFGWRPLLECRAVMLRTCETRWN